MTTVFGASDQTAGLQGQETPSLEGIRHLARHDALGQSFNQGCLAHPGGANQHRVVLCASREHLHHLANFPIPSHHRIQLSLPGQGGEILCVTLQSRWLWRR